MLIFPLMNDLSRKIIHIDMDAFFAAVEIRDNPKLKGKPVIIGSDPRKTGGRGVVSTCSYEERLMNAVLKLFSFLETTKNILLLANRFELFLNDIRIKLNP